MYAPDGIDRQLSVGGRSWDLELVSDQERCEELVTELDPVAVHSAPPCTKVCSLAPYDGQPGYDAQAFERAVGMIEWTVQLIRKRVRAGGGIAGKPAASPHVGAELRASLLRYPPVS